MTEKNLKEAFDIYIVGLGMVGAHQITYEVDIALRRCKEILYLDNGFGVKEHLETLSEKVTDLFPVTYHDGESRIDAYDQMFTAVLAAALDHPPIAFAVYGHPKAHAYPSAQIAQVAQLLGLRVQVLPGISTLDMLFIDIGLYPGMDGLQMYEATDVLVRNRPLLPEVPCVLWQVETVESSLFSNQKNTSSHFQRLQDYLLKYYPPKHPVTAVFTSTCPLISSEITTFPLNDFASRLVDISPVATIYLPPVMVRPIKDKQLMTEANSSKHLHIATVQTDKSTDITTYKILRSDLPVEKIRTIYEQEHFVTICNFLNDEYAQVIAQSIEERRPEFALHYQNGINPTDIKVQRKLSQIEMDVLEHQIPLARQQNLFTYWYNSWRPHANCHHHAICLLADWLGTQMCWDLIESLTGVHVSTTEIVGVTKYINGHYLGKHSDRIQKDGHRRKLAFTLSFSSNWDATKGGVLTLVYPDGKEYQVVPQFNNLTLMDVDTFSTHYVTPITGSNIERITLAGFFCIHV